MILRIVSRVLARFQIDSNGKFRCCSHCSYHSYISKTFHTLDICKTCNLHGYWTSCICLISRFRLDLCSKLSRKPPIPARQLMIILVSEILCTSLGEHGQR